jgi:ATP-dependent Clp protease adaptor protein ClpS
MRGAWVVGSRRGAMRMSEPGRASGLRRLALPTAHRPLPTTHSAPPEAPAAPGIEQDIDLQHLLDRFPPYRVILHNDDVHSMDEVVGALRKSVPGLSTRKAILIMMEAHVTGRATVVICTREQAEYYAERLGTFGLTVTIEPGE